MSRQRELDRVRRLRAITVARGATPHEAATAAALAARLEAREVLRKPAASVTRAPPVAVAAAGPAPGRDGVAGYAGCAGTDRRSPRSLRFVAFA